MNPAPAISTLASAALAGSADLSASASLRGFWRVGLREAHGDIAREIAVLRIARALHFDRRRRARPAAPANPATPPSACRNNVSIKVFKADPVSGKGSAVYPAQPQISIHLQRIHIDRPAQPGGPGQRLDPRQPAVEKALQRRARRGSRSAGARESGRRAARSGRWPDRARVTAPSAAPAAPRGRPRPSRRNASKPRAVPAPRRAAARAASRAASAPRAAPRARCAAKPVVAFGDQAREQRVLGKGGLNQHFPGARGAPGAARDLGDGLGQPLGGAKIAGEQPLIGIQDHHQAHVREVMSLGEHLRADQNARLAADARARAPPAWRRARPPCRDRASRAAHRGNRRASVSSTRSVPWPTGLSGWPQLAAQPPAPPACAPQ